jgi:hypothetical protein
LSVEATAATISNILDSNAEDRTGNPGQGFLKRGNASGNCGGHIRITDIGIALVNGFASVALAGPDFLGDLSAFDGKALSFGRVPFSGGGGTFGVSATSSLLEAA